MTKHLHRRPSPAMVVSIVALIVALGGTGYAAVVLPANSVGSKQLKKNAVSGKKIKKNAVTGAKVKNNSIKGADILESSLGKVPSAANADHATAADNATNATNAANATNAGHATNADNAGSVSGVQHVTKRGFANDGADFATAQAQATKVPLASVGSLSFYGKCFRDTSGPTTYSRIYAETTVGGGLLASDDNELRGGATAEDFLAPTTLEDDREMSEADTSDDGADLDSGYHASFTAVSGDGTTVQGQAESGVKAGTLAGGNGVWGAGNTCLFALTVEQLPNFG
jgi:hypothetical protein